MRYERWVEEFKPIANPFRNDAEIDGFVFSPWGDEYDFVKRQSPDCVWTFLVCDESRKATWLIASGFHWVNRMGYLVTARQLAPGRLLDVRY